MTILTALKKSYEEYKEKTVYENGEQSITFGELYSLASSIGTKVMEHQMPEHPVAVLTGRHVYTPACYLGTAMAGSFYAAMDPTMPDARLKQMLGVIDADLMIVDRENEAKAEELGFEGRVLVMEEMMSAEPDEKALCEAASHITDNTPIYVLFTSGSTGTPKGVLTSHGALMCYLEGLQSVIGLDSSDVLGNQAPLDYIAAIRDMYLPLMTGAKTILIHPSEFAMPQRMLEELCNRGVTTICWSATGLEIPAKLGVFDEGDSSGSISLPPLRRVVFSGSVIANAYLRKWQEAFPNTRFINQYGPTEATGSCTYHVIEELVDTDTVIPIGKPYPNYDILILNDEGKKAERGQPGEICVRGPAIALGYYGSPEQTAANFIRNPNIDKWSETIYRTGDLGRMDEEGVLYFHGRKDRQFKHMGHRIEPEEIEQKAIAFGGIDECVCLYHKHSQIIHLFYSGKASRKDLTIYFREEMPSFMVPRKIKELEELPHLPNGKIDRNSLQEQVDGKNR